MSNPKRLRQSRIAGHAFLSARSARWVIPISIVVLTSAAFMNVLQNGFVSWYDGKTILENPNFRGLGWTHLAWMFTTFHTGHYQPLSWITLALDYLLWGMNPTGYHLTNLLLHGANAVLFYFIGLRVLRIALPSATRENDLAVRVVAGMAALLFSLHPLRVESVAWATERRDVLSASFILGAVIYYLRAVEVGASGSDRRRSMRLALVLYLLSLLSKASGITLPFALLVLDVYPLRRLEGGPGKWFAPAARPILWEKLPFLICAIIAGMIAFAAQYQTGAMEAWEEHGLLARCAQALFGLAFYLWKIVLPIGLSPLYELPPRISPWDWKFLLSGSFVVLVSIGLFVLRKRWPAGLAIWIYFILLLAPVLGIVQSGPQITADRYTYLPCLGWALLAGAGVYEVWKRRGAGISERSFRLANMLVAVVLTTLGLLTWKQIQLWHDSERLWNYIVSVSPNSVFAHNNVGNLLVGQGKLEEALDHFHRALRIRPKDRDVLYNLGNALAIQGKLEEAIEQFHQVLRIDPRYVKARYDLGTALAAQGHSQEAMEEFRRVIEIDAGFAKAHYNLGALLAKQGRSEDAVRYFRQALRIDPTYVRARYSLAFVQAKLGNVIEAVEQYRQALELSPGEFDIHFNYAVALAKQDNLDEAVTQFQQALKIKPDFAQGYHHLGMVLMAQGKVDLAIESFTTALKIQPDFAEAHQSLGQAFASQGKRAEAIQHYQEALRILKGNSGESTSR